MKKNNKVKIIIREIVREEVAMAIREVISELKQPTRQISKSKPKPKKKIVEKKHYSKNSIINDILNETKMDDEWKTMGDGTYDSSKMNEVMSAQYGDLMNGGGEVNADAMISSLGEDPSQVDDSVKKIFTKDYRSLMKKLDEKAKQKRGV